MYAAYQSHQSWGGATASNVPCRWAVSCSRSAKDATSMSVLPLTPGQAGRDLLKQPSVAVRILERRVREVRAPGQVEPGGLRLFLHLGDVDPAAGEIFPGGVDVLDRQVQPVKGSGFHRRDALAEMDRALRVGRRHLHLPEVVTDDQVDVQPPSQALIEALCAIDIRDGHRHHLERHVDRRELLHLGRTGSAYVDGAHVDLRRWVRIACSDTAVSRPGGSGAPVPPVEGRDVARLPGFA